MKRGTTEEFIEKARKVHGDRYDYSKVDYVNAKTKVCIICNRRGEFWQTPNAHLNGQGCPICGNDRRTSAKKSNVEEFIEKARKVHGDKYDYSRTEYVNNRTNVCIICPTHGEFWQVAASHLSGHGCPKCKSERISSMLASNTDEFIERARRVHGDKYDYSMVEYANSKAKIPIVCPKHVSFGKKRRVI